MLIRPINIPIESLARTLSSSGDFAWLDSADGQGVSILAFDSVETRSFEPNDGVGFLGFLSSFPFPCLQPATSDQRPATNLWLSYISYEAYQFNPLLPLKPSHQKNYPLAVFRRYDTYVKIDHSKNEMWFVSSSDKAEEKWAAFTQRAHELTSHVRQRTDQPMAEAHDNRIDSSQQPATSDQRRVASATSRPEYNAAISAIKSALLRGDYYELNYTIEHGGQFNGSPLDLYLHLREIAHAPMMAFFDWPEVKILSASPERFFKIECGLITTNPIKGTIKRGETVDEDGQNKRKLLSSEKDRAELLMVTDMMRNDLGRVCEIGSVHVDNLFGLHTFSHYHHLISDIVGQLKKDTTLADVFCALFPGGSITGAPKIAVMKHIDELEHRARGIYTGAVGCFTDTGIVDFNIPIRTITIEGENLSFSVGGGIVADSTADGEFEECGVKARGMFEVLKFV